MLIVFRIECLGDLQLVDWPFSSYNLKDSIHCLMMTRLVSSRRNRE